MSLPGLPVNASLSDVFLAFPSSDASLPLLECHAAVMRGKISALPIADRELIAAFTARVSGCNVCAQTHTIAAASFGVAPELLERLAPSQEFLAAQRQQQHSFAGTDIDPIDRLSDAEVSAKMKLVLKFARELTLSPSSSSKLAQLRHACLASQWISPAELHDVISVCSLVSLVNRLAAGHGVVSSSFDVEATKKRLLDSSDNSGASDTEQKELKLRVQQLEKELEEVRSLSAGGGASPQMEPSPVGRPAVEVEVSPAPSAASPRRPHQHQQQHASPLSPDSEAAHKARLEKIFSTQNMKEEDLRNEFDALDISGNGFLEKREFREYFFSLDHFGLHPSEKDFERLFSSLCGPAKQYGATSTINFNRFVSFLVKYRME